MKDHIREHVSAIDNGRFSLLVAVKDKALIPDCYHNYEVEYKLLAEWDK